MDNTKRKIVRLNNGITILVLPMKTLLTNVSVSILLGENHEKKKEMEITHYLEHLMARMTSKKYRDHTYIQNELSKRGAITNASVDQYKTNFYIEGLYNDAEFFIDLLANTIKHFRIQKILMKQEKNAVIQELHNLASDRKYPFEKKIWKYKYPLLAYQFDYDKHSNHVKKYSSEQLYNFMKRKVLLHNIIVTVTCPINMVEQTMKLTRKYFNFPNRNPKGMVKFPLYNVLNNKMKIIHVQNPIRNKNTLIRYEVSNKIEYMSKKHLSLICLKEILFNFETGIFYKILRETLGLIYNLSFHLNIDIFNPLSSSYYIETSVKNNQVAFVIKQILTILKTISISDKDIENGKKRIMIKYEYKKFNDLHSYKTYYEKYLLYKNPIIERSEVKEKILKLNSQDIKQTVEDFKKSLLNNGMLFYYSKRNSNKIIKNIIKMKKKISFTSI